MPRRFVTLDVFTDIALTGNPLAVVLNADGLPTEEMQPDYIIDHPDFQFPDELNCVEALLDKHIIEGRGDSVAISAA